MPFDFEHILQFLLDLVLHPNIKHALNLKFLLKRKEKKRLKFVVSEILLPFGSGGGIKPRRIFSCCSFITSARFCRRNLRCSCLVKCIGNKIGLFGSAIKPK